MPRKTSQSSLFNRQKKIEQLQKRLELDKQKLSKDRRAYRTNILCKIGGEILKAADIGGSVDDLKYIDDTLTRFKQYCNGAAKKDIKAAIRTDNK